MRTISYLLIGMLFGFGISLAGMSNPAKVINFFDIAGTWDPSLAFVMLGGVVTAFIGYRLVFKRTAPVLAHQFGLPKSKTIDARLITGAAIFGVGWGIAGYCPGGAIPALGTGTVSVFLFLVATCAGLIIFKQLNQLLSRRATAQG